jgi:ornithine cyclodeaminase/alanine dehydrogenase
VDTDELVYLSRADVEGLGVRMADVVDAVEAAFRLKSSGHAVMPPKVTMTAAEGAFAQVMPAWLQGGPAAGLGVKLVTVFPGNPALGLPATNALIILADASSGLPDAIVEAGLITALRTGASVGVAARHLAAPGVERVGLLGCGAQARTSLRALAAVLPELRAVRCHDARRDAAQTFVADSREMLAVESSARPELVFEICEEPAEVCRGAGVVVSAITMAAAVAPPLGAGLLEPGALAVALDYDAAWPAAAMAECDLFVTDDIAQTLATKAHGPRLAGVPEIDADLGEVVAGLAPGRTSPTQRIFCLNLGIAAEDVVCAGLIVGRAAAAGVGTRLPR